MEGDQGGGRRKRQALLMTARKSCPLSGGVYLKMGTKLMLELQELKVWT